MEDASLSVCMFTRSLPHHVEHSIHLTFYSAKAIIVPTSTVSMAWFANAARLWRILWQHGNDCRYVAVGGPGTYSVVSSKTRRPIINVRAVPLRACAT